MWKCLTKQSRRPITLGSFGLKFGALGKLIVGHLIAGVRHGKSLLIDLVVTASPKNGKS